MSRFNFHTHHSQHADSVRSYDIHERISPEKYFSVGFHPWYIQMDTLEGDFMQLRNLIQHVNCIAIGECGLDRHQGPSLEIQRQVFIRQCELAREVGKPVVVHVVRCYPELWEIIKRFPDVVFALHGFSGNQRWADEFSSLGCYFSFGNLLRPGTPIAEVFKSIPSDKIFLETDDFEESTLDVLYQNAATILGVTESRLEIILEGNWKRFFEKASS